MTTRRTGRTVAGAATPEGTRMRCPAYVEDATAILGWPPLAEPRSVYKALRGFRLLDA